MNPLLFQVSWLLGAASAGDKNARQALHLIYPALIMAHSYSLEQLHSGVVNNKVIEIEEGLRSLLQGYEKLPGETCTQCIIRCVTENMRDYGRAALAAASHTMSKELWVPMMRSMLKSIDEEEQRQLKIKEAAKTQEKLDATRSAAE